MIAARHQLFGRPWRLPKTTILDAIEWALNPRSSFIADDYGFNDLRVDNGICITVSIGGLPIEFKAESKYGLHLRGWSTADVAIRDEPSEGLKIFFLFRCF